MMEPHGAGGVGSSSLPREDLIRGVKIKLEKLLGGVMEGEEESVVGYLGRDPRFLSDIIVLQLVASSGVGRVSDRFIEVSQSLRL